MPSNFVSLKSSYKFQVYDSLSQNVRDDGIESTVRQHQSTRGRDES